MTFIFVVKAVVHQMRVESDIIHCEHVLRALSNVTLSEFCGIETAKGIISHILRGTLHYPLDTRSRKAIQLIKSFGTDKMLLIGIIKLLAEKDQSSRQLAQEILSSFPQSRMLMGLMLARYSKMLKNSDDDSQECQASIEEYEQCVIAILIAQCKREGVSLRLIEFITSCFNIRQEQSKFLIRIISSLASNFSIVGENLFTLLFGMSSGYGRLYFREVMAAILKNNQIPKEQVQYHVFLMSLPGGEIHQRYLLENLTKIEDQTDFFVHVFGFFLNEKSQDKKKLAQTLLNAIILGFFDGSIQGLDLITVCKGFFDEAGGNVLVDLIRNVPQHKITADRKKSFLAVLFSTYLACYSIHSYRPNVELRCSLQKIQKIIKRLQVDISYVALFIAASFKSLDRDDNNKADLEAGLIELIQSFGFNSGLLRGFIAIEEFRFVEVMLNSLSNKKLKEQFINELLTTASKNAAVSNKLYEIIARYLQANPDHHQAFDVVRKFFAKKQQPPIIANQLRELPLHPKLTLGKTPKEINGRPNNNEPSQPKKPR